MKKTIFSFALLSLLVMSGGIVFGDVSIGSGDNAVILGPNMGPTGLTPVTEVIKVSTGSTTSAAVGDVMVWDYSNAADGYHVKRASANSESGTEVFAGVMVSKTSKETEYSYSSPKASGPTVGYMAVRGLARAKIDISKSAPGSMLRLNGATVAASFATYQTTLGVQDTALIKLSQDIGILLEEAYQSDGVNRVWLK